MMRAFAQPWPRAFALAALSGAALCALAPFLSDYVLHVLNISLYYTIMAASWNLLAGYTGRFSLAHQAFAAIGAYASGLLMTRYDWPIWLSMPAGVAAATASGWLMGRMVLRMRAIYLAIATWAFAETIHILLTAGYTITRGELGLTVPPLVPSLSPRISFYIWIGVTGASVLGLYAIVRSPLGLFMRAVRDDELRAESLGVDTVRAKMTIFTLTSGFAGLAGVFYGHYVVVLSPQIADFSEMAKIVIMTVVGGLGSFAGPLIGAAPLNILHSYLAKFGEWDMAIFALVVIVFMRANMGGVAAMVAGLWRRALPSSRKR